VEFWLVPSLARPSDDSSDPVQRYSDEIAYHLMTDAGFGCRSRTGHGATALRSSPAPPHPSSSPSSPSGVRGASPLTAKRPA